jgi:hypothetical protein
MWRTAIFVFLMLVFPSLTNAAQAGEEQMPDYRALSFVPEKTLRGDLKDLQIDVVFPDSRQGNRSKDAMIKVLRGQSFRMVKDGDQKSYTKKCEVLMREWVLNEDPQNSEQGITFTVFCGRPDTELRPWSPTFDNSEAVMAYIRQFPFPSQ